MNKQELIDKLKRHLTVMSEVEVSEYDKGYKYATKQHLAMIAELDEPEKPVVPQFVADWYEENKDYFEWNLYNLCVQFNFDESELNSDVAEWFGHSKNKPFETLVKMKLYGYEIEKEKLYYVNIPNVYHGDFGYSETHDNYSFYNKSDATEVRFELTESEIKLEHEWAWQFAKEVEE